MEITMNENELEFKNKENQSFEMGSGQTWLESEGAECTRRLSDRSSQRSLEKQLRPLSRPRATSCDHLSRNEARDGLIRKGFTSLQSDLHAASSNGSATVFSSSTTRPQAENITYNICEHSIDIPCENFIELSEDYSAEQTPTSGSNIESGYNTDRDCALQELPGQQITVSDSTLQILMANWFRHHNPEVHSNNIDNFLKKQRKRRQIMISVISILCLVLILISVISAVSIPSYSRTKTNRPIGNASRGKDLSDVNPIYIFDSSDSKGGQLEERDYHIDDSIYSGFRNKYNEFIRNRTLIGAV